MDLATFEAIVSGTALGIVTLLSDEKLQKGGNSALQEVAEVVPTRAHAWGAVDTHLAEYRTLNAARCLPAERSDQLRRRSPPSRSSSAWVGCCRR